MGDVKGISQIACSLKNWKQTYKSDIIEEINLRREVLVRFQIKTQEEDRASGRESIFANLMATETGNST